MKPWIGLLVFLSMYNYSSSQVDLGYREHGEYLDVYNAGDKIPANDHPVQPDILLLNQQWATGAVVFDNGRQVSNIALQFDVPNNTLHFKKDSTVYVFAHFM